MIGERLEEARKRKGVSMREAAEATKIRGDYLMAMEDNSFDIPLPQIYIRGFLCNYARLLKLDPVRILTDYDAHLLGRAPQSHTMGQDRPTRESLGVVELKPQQPAGKAGPAGADEVVVTEAPEDDGPEPELRFNLDRDRQAASKPPPTLERTGTRHDQEDWNENKTLYMKIGIVFAGILLVGIILVILIQLMGGGKASPEINAELARPPAATPSESPAALPAQSSSSTIILTASDNITLIVEQTLDRQRLYSGSLNAGETLSLDKEGPVSIRFTNGSALLIETDGRQVRPAQAGVGRTVVE
jgi:cytoskeleton protein RodZ